MEVTSSHSAIWLQVQLVTRRRKYLSMNEADAAMLVNNNVLFICLVVVRCCSFNRGHSHLRNEIFKDRSYIQLCVKLSKINNVRLF